MWTYRRRPALLIELHHSNGARLRPRPDAKASACHITEETASSIEIPRQKSEDHDDFGSAKIQVFEGVASYNRPDQPMPTVLVPDQSSILTHAHKGIPPKWNPPSKARALTQDTSQRYIDQNVDRTPISRPKPLILAVQTKQPGFEFSIIDIVTDRKPIRDLLWFSNGEPTTFKFGITNLGNLEDNTREILKKQGFRAGFEREYLQISAAAQGSSAHHSIVEYEFGGMSFLLRYAVDGYLHE
ncbi:hypothetical protein ABVK25_007641 [Lepraria finkii]|uniref:Uncharacterized protein n=1 Tax=Lepraria finkii TaxID=1340010 RepID=A0ABR4B2S2_9LECA